jgi:hypothetical protein
MKNKRSVILVFVFLILLIGISSIVYGQQDVGEQFRRISDQFSNFNPGEIYDIAPYAWDFAILLGILLAISRLTLENKFEGAGGKWLVRFMGLALTSTTVVFLARNDRTLIGDSGPFIVTLIVIAAGTVVFKYFKEQHAGMAAGIYLLLYYGITRWIPPVGEFINSIETLATVINISLIIAGLVFLWNMISMFSRSGPASDVKDAYHWGKDTFGRGSGSKNEKKANRDEQRTDRQETRTETDVLRRLRELRDKLGNLKRGVASQDDFNAIKDDLTNISNDLGDMRTELRVEIREEEISGRHDPKLSGYIAREKNLMRVFDSTFRDLHKSVKENDFERAKKDLKSAEDVIRLLIKINTAERVQLSRDAA